MHNHIALIGMMGSGKTTVGRLLAEHLGRPFLDSDEQVERRTGKTVRQIFEEKGEAAFREQETAALEEALGSETPSVIAAAGGVVIREENRRMLRDDAEVFWLRAKPSILVRRAATGDHRPLLEQDPLGTMVRLNAERKALYALTADHIIDVDDLTPSQVVETILGTFP